MYVSDLQYVAVDKIICVNDYGVDKARVGHFVLETKLAKVCDSNLPTYRFYVRGTSTTCVEVLSL